MNATAPERGKNVSHLQEVEFGYLMMTRGWIGLVFYSAEEKGWIVEEFARGPGWLLFEGNEEEG